MKTDIQKMLKELNQFSTYMPAYKLKQMDNFDEVKKAIEVAL